MLNDKIIKHPALRYAQDLASICQPLQQLKINYFAHVHVDSDGNFSALNNNPKFMEHYLSNEYYNNDIHTANTDKFGKYILWDSLERSGKSEKMHAEAAHFGVQHTFTIVEKNAESTHFYHFANDMESSETNQIYLANLDLLKVFITYFNKTINQSIVLADAHKNTFKIDTKNSGYLLNSENDVFSYDSIEFMRSITPKHKLKPMLSYREAEIVSQLVRGKTAKHIAYTLGLSQRTVEKYLENIKFKFNAGSKSDLIEKCIDMFL